MFPRRFWIVPFLCLTACSSAAPPAIEKPTKSQAHDWPQWQGVRRDGVSAESGLLKSWPKDGPELAWKANDLGDGFSTPSVAGGRIYTMGNRGRTEYVIALDEDNGQQLWIAPTGRVRDGGGGYPGPRCTPTVDGELIYALGLNGDLLCLNAVNGKEIWRKDIRKSFRGSQGHWGYSESPLVDGDKVIVTPGGGTSTIVAFNKQDGATAWECKVPEADSAAYSSAIVADVDGQRQYIQFLSRGVVGVAATDGKFLWRYDRPANGTANCSTAVFSNNMVFAASGYGTGGGLARLVREGDETHAEQVFFTRSMKNHHGGYVLLDGHLYGCNDPNMLTCLEFATGKLKWEERTGKGSIAAADGCLYYRDENGPILLIEASPSGFSEKGRFRQPNRSDRPAWPHPVIANGKLYIRDQEVLLCYDIKEKK